MEEMVQQALTKGVNMHVSGEFELASQLYGSVIKLDPNHADANHNMGLLKVDTGEALEALPYLQTALQADTSIAQFWISYIRTLIKVDRKDEAIRILYLAEESGVEVEDLIELRQKLNEIMMGTEPAKSETETLSQIKPNILNTLTLDKALKLAREKIKIGALEEAKGIYKEILEKFPQNKKAVQGFSTLKKSQQSDTEQAPRQETINQLINLFQKGELSTLIEKAQALLDQYPNAFAVWNILGAAYKRLNQYDNALKSYRRSISINPSYFYAHYNLGNILKEVGKLSEAIESFEKALFLKPDYAKAQNNKALTLHELGELDAASVAFNKLILLNPNFAEAHNNLGNVFQEQGLLEQAIEAYTTAISLNPDYSEAFNNLGNAFKERGEVEKAIEAYKKTLSIKHSNYDVTNNIGISLREYGNLEDAKKSYNKALTASPDHPEAHNNLGVVLHDQGRLKEAIEAYTKAIALNPDYAEAYNNLGTALIDLGKRKEAIEAYEKALSINADHATARSQKLHEQAHIFDWESIEADRFLFPTLGITEKFVTPFAFLSLEDDPARHLLRAQNYVKHKFPQKSAVIPARPVQRPERLRIGYFSADFHNFPGMYLMAGMLEQHDRSKFEIFAFSYGPKTNDEMQKRIIAAVDHFIDIQNMPTTAVRECALEHKLDIALHRNGHTKNGRTELFAERLAPIQINYLGYPGTLGTDFIDYIVADTIVIPEDKQKHYSEQIIYLPHTYQPNDNTRAISQKTFTRADMRLPDKSFVFCCFNKNYKISPKEFDIWMRLLGKVEGSVLWLLKSDQLAEKKLCLEAEKRGVNAERLIFADRLPQDEHLARHKLADLFLDTFNYNAHTTTSDALWAGLPIVTKLGKSFSARVAGSLLNSIGLQELITHSEAEYEELILRLSLQPETLSEIKKKLSANRLSYPLFDTQKYTKNIEQAYHLAYERYFNDQKPSTIIVPT